MKVILLENVKRIGSIGEVIDVKRGYARNFLIANKKALYASKDNIKEVEEGKYLEPKFDENGLIPVITSDFKSGDILMHGYMNNIALKKTIETQEAHYWSRSRELLWKKGESSGMTHKVDQILIDDDQDSVWLKVTIDGLGASCHVGYKLSLIHI